MLILYFAIGTVVMKFVKKKEGIAVIPNVTFWRSAPVLVKVRRSFFFRKWHWQQCVQAETDMAVADQALFQ